MWSCFADGRCFCCCVQVISRNIVDVNRPADNGNTPLHVAASFGDEQLVKLLLAARGINVNASNNSADGATPLHLAVMHGKSSLKHFFISVHLTLEFYRIWCIRYYYYYYSNPIGKQSIAINLSVCLFCLSICPRAYLWNHWTDLHKIFGAEPLWPWLSPPLAALWYVMYFWFYGWRHIWPYWAIWWSVEGWIFNLLPLVALWYWGGVWCLWMPCC